MKSFRYNDVNIQSHRGGLYDRPENTMAAYKYSWDMEGVIPEVDIRTTKDGDFICLHDKTLKRTVKAPFYISYLNIKHFKKEILQRFDAGIKYHHHFTGEQIPLLSDVFIELAKNCKRQIYLDIKEVDLYKLTKLITHYRVKNQLIFVSDNLKLCMELKNLYNDSKTMTWISGSNNTIKDKFKHISMTDYRGLSQLQLHLHTHEIDGILIPDLGYEFLTNAVRETENRSVQLSVRLFSFNFELLNHLLSLNIRWFVVDRPADFLQVLNQIRKI